MKKSLILALSSMAVLGGSVAFGISFSNGAIRANAEAEQTSIVDSSDSSSASEDVSSSAADSDSQNNFYKEAVEWIDNKIIPLLGSVSLVSIIGMVTSISTAITKGKGDKKNSTIIKSQDERIALLEASVKAHEEYERKMLEQFTVTFTETSKTLLLVSNYAKATADLVATQNGEIKKVTLMKDSIDVSCNLIAKSMALSDVAVKSGIAKDAKKLVENLKEVSKNDDQG